MSYSQGVLHTLKRLKHAEANCSEDPAICGGIPPGSTFPIIIFTFRHSILGFYRTASWFWTVGSNINLQMGWNVSLTKLCQPQNSELCLGSKGPNLYPNSWSCSISMQMNPLVTLPKTDPPLCVLSPSPSADGLNIRKWKWQLSVYRSFNPNTHTNSPADKFNLVPSADGLNIRDWKWQLSF